MTITALDVSSNSALINFSCSKNQLTNLDVSNLTVLGSLSCGENQLSSLEVPLSVTALHVANNLITTLDLSANTGLTTFNAQKNLLTSLNLKNGNNHNIDGNSLEIRENSELNCITVDDVMIPFNNFWWGKALVQIALP